MYTGVFSRIVAYSTQHVTQWNSSAPYSVNEWVIAYAISNNIPKEYRYIRYTERAPGWSLLKYSAIRLLIERPVIDPNQSDIGPRDNFIEK